MVGPKKKELRLKINIDKRFFLHFLNKICKTVCQNLGLILEKIQKLMLTKNNFNIKYAPNIFNLKYN